MTSIVGLDDLSKALIDAGNHLLTPPASTHQLLSLLDEIESLLTNVEQDQPLSMQTALIPSKNALVSVDLLSHPDSDVRASVVSCLTQLSRITAPEPPYSDHLMKEIFRLTIEAFDKLADTSSPSYKKAESVLDNVSKVRSCLVMLDLGCHDLILLMFQKFFQIIRSYHPQLVFSSMEMIMITMIDETDELSTDLLNILLATVRKENQHVSPMSWSLVENVLRRCACKLKPYIIKALKSNRTTVDMYSPVVSFIFHSVTKEKKVSVTKLGKQVAPSDSSEENLDLGHFRKAILPKRSSKRPARDGTRRINEIDNVRNGNNSNLLKQSLQQVRSESTELEITGKRGRKPNSLMNPEEGYEISWISKKQDSIKTSSNKKLLRKGSGGESSLGRVAAKKTPLRKETSLKQSRFKMDDSDHDLDSLSSPRLKKLASCFREEELNPESFEISEDERKIGEKSSKKIRSQNGLEKCQRTGKKKQIVETKTANSSRKRSSVPLNAKRKHSEGASQDTCASQSSNSKESELGENLVGKKVNIWWPLDNTFYEGVIDCYSSRKKTHRVIYYDGESEELNLDKERWELLDDEEKETEMPEYIPLYDILQRQKGKKKSKNAAGMPIEVKSEGGGEDSEEDEPKWRETEEEDDDDVDKAEDR